MNKMTRLEPYLSHPLAEAVGWALLHSLWQGALVALLFAGSLGLARRRSPQLRYLLGCGALALLVALPLGTGAFLYGRAEPLALQARVGLDADPLTTQVQGAVRDESMITATPAQPAASPSLAPSSAPSFVTALGARALELLRTAAPWLTGLWLLGVVLFLLRFSGQALYVHRFRTRHRTPTDAHWQARARTLAARLGVRRPWQLVQSSRADTPLTFGVLRPLIVLPTSALTGMPAAQLEALLAHELEHVRRHDYLVNLFQCVVEALMFYHPAVWWVSSTVRRAREECCDDASVAVCGDAKLYARALTNLEALRQPPALALAATDAPLLARVKRLLGLGEARPFPPTATSVLLVFMLVLGTGLSVVGQTTAQEAPTASPPAPEAPKQGSLLEGIVAWNDERVPNITVELREEPEDDEIERWDTTPALQTTKTNVQGQYRFENVPAGNYVVWIPGHEKGYQAVGYPAIVYAGTNSMEIWLDKIVETIAPVGTTVKTLTPTLRWKPVSGAVRYEVGIDDLASSEDPLAIRRYYRTDTPNLELPEPLQRDRFYSWSVTAYTENGTQIASAYEPMFSTGRPKTLRPVKVRGVGVSTVLPTDWQQTSPGVFEYVDAEGEKSSLTFEKRSRADLEAGLEEEALAELRRFPQRYADREWGYLAGNGVAKLVTVGNGNVYLITVNGLALADEEMTFPAIELLGIVIPTMLRNFKLDEQASSAFEPEFYGIATPHTPQDELDEQPFFTFEY